MGNDEKDKMMALLRYWVEHNREHSSEFQEWADKARAMGEADIAGKMMRAAQEMEKAGGLLAEALARLEEG